MGLSVSTTSQSTVGMDQDARSGGSQHQSRHTAFIHILDDDSLLHVFYLYRPFLLDEDQDDDARLRGRSKGWVHRRWWYTLAHVCRRWRRVIFGSAAYLELSLVCTYGTPVADMLAHSPPLPLAIDYRFHKITAEDKEGIILALKQHDRVRRIRLGILLQKLIVAMDGEYPILEYMVIKNRAESSTILRFPGTFQAPHLRHLRLTGFVLPIGSRLLTTPVDLVTLHLVMVHPSTYLHPNILFQWISLMPQLETLTIFFKFPISSHDVESLRQLTHTPIIAPVTLPNLHRFRFHGVSTYFEALVRRITTPRLEKLRIEFFNQLMFSVPRLFQLMNTTENLRFDSASFRFSDERVSAVVHPQGMTERYALGIVVHSWHLDWQVSSMAQISNSLRQIFSAVERITLEHDVHVQSSEEHNEVDRAEWRKFLRPFNNVKTLRIADGLIKDISRCLELEDGDLPLELLPELEELAYSGIGDTGDAFTSFIKVRRDAGRPLMSDLWEPASPVTSVISFDT